MTTLGFTGTMVGITVDQMDMIDRVIETYGVTELHHGDCIGADEIAHRAAICSGVSVVIHPPDVDAYRAFCTGYREIMKVKPFLERNYDIVKSSDLLLACPLENNEKLKFGTWATVRYAKKRGKEIVVALPDGRVLHYNPSRESLANDQASKPGKGR